MRIGIHIVSQVGQQFIRKRRRSSGTQSMGDQPSKHLVFIPLRNNCDLRTIKVKKWIFSFLCTEKYTSGNDPNIFIRHLFRHHFTKISTRYTPYVLKIYSWMSRRSEEQ